jgi:hypothetical protein
MWKGLPLFIIGIFIVNGLGAVVVVGYHTKQETQVLSPSILTINNDKYEVNAKYSYIRSYPGGGGIFIIKMTPKNDFCGYVSLKIDADSNLNARLDKYILNKNSQIAELTIQPNKQIELKTYEIKLTTTYHKNSRYMRLINWISKIRFPFLSNLINFLFRRFKIDQEYVRCPYNNQKLLLKVEMFSWTSDSLADAIIKRDELIDWLETEHPEFGVFSGKNSYAYITYPAHLIVEHWTFLYDKWEMRICFHVMIPPYNWSMIGLRPRGEFDFVFAAKREYNGTTYEIPISDYPIFYGY